jgi:hypothetical protein
MTDNTVTFGSLLKSNIIKYLMMGRSLELVTSAVRKVSFVSQRVHLKHIVNLEQIIP